MRGTVDHPFPHQFGPHGSHTCDLHPQGVGDVAGAMSAWSKFGNSPQETLLAGRQAIKADTKEILI